MSRLFSTPNALQHKVLSRANFVLVKSAAISKTGSMRPRNGPVKLDPDAIYTAEDAEKAVGVSAHKLVKSLPAGKQMGEHSWRVTGRMLLALIERRWRADGDKP